MKLKGILAKTIFVIEFVKPYKGCTQPDKFYLF